MNGKLNQAQIDYVLYHLGFLCNLDNNILECIWHGNGLPPDSPYILLPLSEKELNLNKVKWIGDIPVLYPLNGASNKFFKIENKNLIFNHDLLKSAFHLLSGFEEYKSDLFNSTGHFPYRESLQYKLKIIKRPIVNYYFEIIMSGIEKFCHINEFTFIRKSVLNSFGFFLTHDIDRITKYHFWEVILKLLELIRLKPSIHSLHKRFSLLIRYIKNSLKLFRRENPFWNFSFLIQLEKKYGMKSTFFFLEKYGLHKNSRYRFHEKRIRELITWLVSEKCEIGLHGTIQSSSDLTLMLRTLNHLQQVTPESVIGIRQHCLKIIIPETILIQEKAGLKYDTSLGFPEHEGFRNSYCLPFKLFDFEQNKMINVWEFPLIIMDTTLTNYRKLSFLDAENSLMDLLKEVKRFNGLFTLLWHNCHFDEDSFPGITDFYKSILKKINKMQPEILTGKEILSRLNNK